MLNFDNVEDLVAHMFEIVDSDEPVSIVANKDLAILIMTELLEYNNVIIKYANVDDYEYDREYIVTLHDDLDTDDWDIAIEPIYNYEKEMYFGTDGYVLFHEDVNSKALIDIQNNEYIEMSGHDWFIIGEFGSEPDSVDNDEKKNTSPDFSFTIETTVDMDEAQKIFEDMEKDLRREMADMIDMLYRPQPFCYISRIFC